jgi:hypothetical protein
MVPKNKSKGIINVATSNSHAIGVWRLNIPPQLTQTAFELWFLKIIKGLKVITISAIGLAQVLRVVNIFRKLLF